MGEPLAYLLTWTTYGTWLPGDARGWVDRHRRHGEVIEPPDRVRESQAKERMTEDAVVLDARYRQVAEQAIREACTCKGWFVHALDVRSNHVHVVVSASGALPGEVVRVLKAYASRAMNGLQVRGHWWTHGGSKRYLNTEKSLYAAIEYVQNQDTAWMRSNKPPA